MVITTVMEYEEVKELMQSLCKERDWNSIATLFICLLGNRELIHEDSIHHQPGDFLEERLGRACELLKAMHAQEYTEKNLCRNLLMVYVEMSEFLGLLKDMDDQDCESSSPTISATEFQPLSSPSTELIKFVNIILADVIISKEENMDIANKIAQSLTSAETNTGLSISGSSSERIIGFWDSVLQKHQKNEAISMQKSRSFTVDPETVQKISSTADVASEHIYKAAIYFQKGMKNVVVPNVNKGIEVAGEFVKKKTTSAENKIDFQEEDSDDCLREKKSDDSNLDEVIALTDASVGATDAIRVGARSAMFGLRDFSTRKINDASAVWQEKQIGKQIIPDDDTREMAKAAGKVGLAALGASAIFVETMFDATSEVAKKSVNVASDVTTHTHGEEAGKVVKNTGVAAGNILRTMTHVGAFEAGIMTKVVARNTAKVNMVEALNQQVEIGASLDDQAVPVISTINESGMQEIDSADKN